MSEKRKMVCTTLNYIKHDLIFTSIVWNVDKKISKFITKKNGRIILL